MSLCGRRRRRVLIEVEDALTAVALHQTVVASEVVEGLGTQADVTRRAVPVARLHHRGSPASDQQLEGGYRRRRDLADERLTRGGDLLELRLERAGLAFQPPPLGVNLGLLGHESRLCLLD